MARNTHRRRRHRGATDHRDPREVRLRPRLARLERCRRARGASHVLQLARLRDRRRASRGRRGRARGTAVARAVGAGERARPRGEARHGGRRARQRHHLAHLRLRRHAPQDDHPSRGTGGLGGAGARRASRPAGPRGGRRHRARHRRRLPHRQRDVPRSLRPRLAHHRLDRHARRGGWLCAPACSSTSNRRPWRSASPRRSRSGCASSSAP